MRVLAYLRSTLIVAVSAILPLQAQTIVQPVPGEEIAAYLPGGERIILRWIPSGSDTIGTTPERAKRLLALGAHKTEVEGEQPAHLFQTKGFYLGQYEITQKQWVSVMGTKPWGPYLPYDPDAPAVCISWDRAVGFVAVLNRAIGADLYRLPTEEEWEYACRAGTDAIWYFGDSDDELGEHAWVFANSAAGGKGPPYRVGQKKPNLWGLFDMYGNAREWCSNRPNEYVHNGFVGPAQPWRGEFRAVRGGSRNSSSLFARSAARSASVPSTGYNILQGVRIVRDAIVQSGAREPVR